LRAKTGEKLDYLPAQDASMQARFPGVSRRELDTAMQLLETDGCVYSGAEAVFRVLAYGRRRHSALWAYQYFPAFARASEWVYRLVADHRAVLSRSTRRGWGAS
jgi:predicted DCC family thiol-disulfide oxidoreductase YuxK